MIFSRMKAFWFSLTLASDGSFQALCNGNYLRPLRIEVWDWDRNGKHDHLGVVTTTLQALLEGQGEEMQLEVIHYCVILDLYGIVYMESYTWNSIYGIVYTHGSRVFKVSI